MHRCLPPVVLATTVLLLPAVLRAADAPLAAKPTRPEELTARDFFRPPTLSSVRLNPAGTHLAALVYEEPTDSTGLRIVPLDQGKPTGLRGTKSLDIRSFVWVGDERLVYLLTRDNLYASGLYAIPRDTPADASPVNQFDVVQVLGSPAARPDHLFVWVRREARHAGRPGPLLEVSLKRRLRAGFDVAPAHWQTSINEPDVDEVLGWLRDGAGEIRYAFGHRKGVVNIHRREANGKWTAVPIDLDRDRPLAVDTTDPQSLLVAHLADDGACELVRYHTVDGTRGPAILRDEKYDFSGASVLQRDGDEGGVVGLTYARQAPTTFWLRDEEHALQAAVDRNLPPDRVNLILGRNRGGNRMIVHSFSDRHPGSIYLVDLTTDRIRQVADLAPWLPESLLGPVRLTSYITRDGLKLDAYVTLPAGHDPKRPAPLIVLPHGGPWARDYWGYDAESQFFASRGYVVFRPNYRGSTGYHPDISLKHSTAFVKMHEDVTDGVRALIRSGIADPERIAIVGSSFGGYLAVCGAAFEPDLYRCAVTVAGVFDWARVIREAGQHDGGSFRREKLLRDLGDPKKNEERFEAMSPLGAADRIKIPIFIAHGKEDQIADARQSTRLARTLKQSGVPHETHFVNYEGHGFFTLKNRVELYERIESFLKKHL